jgi:hypothetical protein
MTTVGYERLDTNGAPQSAMDEAARPACLKTYPDTNPERFPQSRNDKPEVVNEVATEVVNEEIPLYASPSAPQVEHSALGSQFSALLSGVLDNFSFLFFCVSFSSLTHLLGSWWNRFLAEE